jgi:hypothetical protein
MSDFVLPDGKEITFDLSQMTYGQWLGLFDAKESDERSDKTLARVCGIAFKEIKELPFLEYKRLFNAFLKKSREPLSDPNA